MPKKIIIISIFMSFFFIMAGCRNSEATSQQSEDEWNFQVDEMLNDDLKANFSVEFPDDFKPEVIEAAADKDYFLNNKEQIKEFLFKDIPTQEIKEEVNDYEGLTTVIIRNNERCLLFGNDSSSLYYSNNETLSDCYNLIYSGGTSAQIFSRDLERFKGDELPGISQEAARELSDEMLTMSGFKAGFEPECYALDVNVMNDIWEENNFSSVSFTNRSEWIEGEDAYLFIYQGNVNGIAVGYSENAGLSSFAYNLVGKDGIITSSVGCNLSKIESETVDVIPPEQMYEIIKNRFNNLMIKKVEITDLSLTYEITEYSFDTFIAELSPVWICTFSYEESDTNNSSNKVINTFRFNAITGKDI
ncbi:hypothetical protein [Konateibacter massiliensis]|uniref:hypothetical protein n=1 Tax=Konateibacter massiliensis TaxID=2002841 RepID=UPI000C15E073|nr:hypothetical protein [Konateibacter massiliensis]